MLANACYADISSHIERSPKLTLKGLFKDTIVKLENLYYEKLWRFKDQYVWQISKDTIVKLENLYYEKLWIRGTIGNIR